MGTLFALLSQALRSGPRDADPPDCSVRSPARAPERRRAGSCAYRADAWGDRLVGYDGAQRAAWVVRLDRAPQPRMVG